MQARLTIDNTADSWLTRMFTAEYAGLFDVFLPGLAAWRLPLPLGGSSNHFRTAVLRKIGAWDPYNVTEDADLGMRLARFGFRTSRDPVDHIRGGACSFPPWLKQRTRWLKGWMLTWVVHMRAPLRLLRELRPAGFAVFQLLVGGRRWRPWFTAVRAANDLDVDDVRRRIRRRTFSGFTGRAALVSGYLISAALGLIGLARRGLLGCAWALLFMPVYWMLFSLAAWRALLQLLRNPYRWEKTEHGLARTSRRRTARPLRNNV